MTVPWYMQPTKTTAEGVSNCGYVLHIDWR